MIGCDGSQQGRQSGGQNHNTSIVTLGFYMREGRGAETGEERDLLAMKSGIHTQVVGGQISVMQSCF